MSSVCVRNYNVNSVTKTFGCCYHCKILNQRIIFFVSDYGHQTRLGLFKAGLRLGSISAEPRLR